MARLARISPAPVSPARNTVELASVKDRILAGDCIENLKTLPDGCADLVFADPPYNLQLQGALERPDRSKVAAVTDSWDQFESLSTYDNFTRAWLTEAKRVLKKDGAIWVIGSYHNIFRVGAILQDLGFWICNDIIWRKSNPMPNFKGTRFTNAHETLIWATRSPDARPTFHYEFLKEQNDGVQMRSDDWFIPLCTGDERLKDDADDKVHSTQKPEELLKRVILSTTRAGDVIVDPFFGSGTTGAVAKRLGRHFIGLEREEKYIKAATARIDTITPETGPDGFVPFEAKREKPRLSLAQVLSCGLLKAGDVVTDKMGRHAAIICADGFLRAADGNDLTHRSIHKLGALAIGAERVNGWDFWHVERGGRMIVLDEFRESARKMIFAQGGSQRSLLLPLPHKRKTKA